MNDYERSNMHNDDDSRTRYMKNNYPLDWNTRTMTTFDTKMVNMLVKIRDKYGEHYTKRSHTILIEKCPPKMNVPPPPPLKPRTEKKMIEVDVQTCKAITIRTNSVCGKKGKNGTCFCGIHSKSKVSV
jgi:hypothetical protein